ncbi:MAG: cytochrome c [Bryobacteraceae bacterium]|nr:MAG: cytochrome c [Bryobacteraceae bacterium]
MKWTLAALLLITSTVLVSSTQSPFTQRDKAFYADEATINFVRPGLVFKILGHEIAADGTVKVRFRITDPKGVPLEREGINTPGPVSTSFILAYLPNDGNHWRTYTTRLKTSTWPPTAGKQARQSSADSGGSYQKVADGEYIYTFGTKLPANYDKTATHAISLYGNRNLSEFELGVNYATDNYYFVPDGSAVKRVRQVITTESCNKCHEDLRFHGGSRKGMDNCILCHSPAYTIGNTTVQNINPETGNTIDMTVMIHKIHMGANLPSVRAGQPYRIVGFGNNVADYSKIGMPSGANNCQWCHVEKNDKAAQKDAWLSNPTRAACGSCHDNVNFATGENHLGIIQVSDNQCKNCHIPQGELDFDASILGAHITEQNSSLVRGAVAKIERIENAQPGKKPVITFSLKDRAGNPMAISDLIPGAGRGRLAFTLAPLDVDYGLNFGTATTKGYVNETVTVTSVTGTPGLYTYTMNTAIPADAKGTWTIALEGRTDEKVLEGTLKERVIEVNIPNDVKYVSVDGSPVQARRVVTTTATCNQCHARLSFHGENRNEIDNCVICHNPSMTDAARRPAAQAPPESINMATMIHRIHTGEEQPRDYTIYGFGNVPHNYNHVLLPPPATGASCTLCHVNNSQQAPSKGVLAVTDPRGWLNPVQPTAAACLGCHASREAASHALAHTTTLGESCGVCHGPNATYSVNKVHAQ